MRSLLSWLSIVLCLLALLPACGSSSADFGGSPSGNLGATPGGAQDVGLFRQKIQAGQVPLSTDLTVEGMLAEHDLPLVGSACVRALCLDTATAIATGADDGQNTAWVQVGFSSSWSAESFVRADLDLAVVVDRSGSMAGDKIAAARHALQMLVAKLGPRDRLSIVLFDDRVDTLLAPTFVTESEKARIAGLIESIRERGATDIEKGLAAGFRLLEGDLANKERSHRVMLFTDALPNTGRTDTESFLGLAKKYAVQGAGLTAFGIGLDFGISLAHDLSQVRGGAYYFLENAAKLRTVFDKDFDYLVTPIAYDLKVRIGAKEGWSFTTPYGVPTASFGKDGVSLDVPTVFVSRGRGAILLRFSARDAATAASLAAIAHLTIEYTKPDGGKVTSELDATYGGKAAIGEGFEWYQQEGVRKAVALANWVLGARRALQARERGDRKASNDILAATRATFEKQLAALPKSTELDRELALLDRLISLAK